MNDKIAAILVLLGFKKNGKGDYIILVKDPYFETKMKFMVYEYEDGFHNKDDIAIATYEVVNGKLVPEDTYECTLTNFILTYLN